MVELKLEHRPERTPPHVALILEGHLRQSGRAERQAAGSGDC